MGRDRDRPWDEEPVGDYDTGRRRRWRRPWNNYLTIMIGLFGAFMVMGAASVPDWTGVAAGLCVLAVPLALLRADGPKARAGRPPPPAPSLTVELLWYGVAAVLLVVGVFLTTV